MITFLCPNCGAQLKSRAAGKTARCPSCGNAVTAPEQSHDATEEKSEPFVLETEDLSSSPSHPTGDSRAEFQKQSDVDAADLSFLAPPQQPGEIGRLGPYRVLKVLGAGGMGIVFQAEHLTLKRLVALKVMRPNVAAKEVNRQRFLREAQLMAQIEHENIVTIYDIGEDHGFPYLAMQLLQGQSLDEALKQQGGWLPVQEVVRIGREVAQGLAAAHQRGLIHRDIKPANIWLESGRNRVKIVDFGLARVRTGEDVSLTQSGTIVGTPAYMAPEQAGGENVDNRCDLFSLGAVLYRAATGQLPFQGKDTMSLLMSLATKDPEPPSSLDPGLPASFSNFVLELLAKDPKDRPGSAEEVIAVLDKIERECQELAVSATMMDASPLVPVKRPPSRELRSVTPPPTSEVTETRPKPVKPKREPETPAEPRPVRKPRSGETEAVRIRETPSRPVSRKRPRGARQQAVSYDPLRLLVVLGILMGVLVVLILGFLLAQRLWKRFGHGIAGAPRATLVQVSPASGGREPPVRLLEQGAHAPRSPG